MRKRSEVFTASAKLAKRHYLRKLYALCEGQRTVTTAKLDRMLAEAGDEMADDAWRLGQCARQR